MSTFYTLRNPKCSPDKILKLMVTTTRSNQDHTMMLYTYNPKAMSLPSINFLHFTTSEILSGQILQVKVTMARSKVKSRSHHDFEHLQLPNNIPTTYQLPSPYGFQDIVWTRFYRPRLLQGQRSNQGYTMTWHTYTP